MVEPGSTEGQVSKPTGGEPFSRETGDMSSFSTAEKHLKSLQSKEDSAKSPFPRKEGQDLSPFTEASSKFAEATGSPELEKTIQELSKVAENVAIQDAAVDLIKAHIDWAKTTGDAKIPRLLSGNIAMIVRRFATNPNQVSENVAAWTEEDVNKIKQELTDKGIISKDSNSQTSATANPATTSNQ